MESRKGPKFRKKKKNKGDEKTLAERIMLEREAAAQEAERNSSKSQGSSSLETSSEPNPALQATPKDLSEAANTPGSDRHLSPSESVDISHLTKDSDQKKRTPTPEPTLSASHSEQLPSPSSAQKPPQNHGSAAQLTDNKVEAATNIQSSYQQPLQPAYAAYPPENSLSNQSNSQQQSQHQQQQILQRLSTSTPSQKQSGFQSEVGRSIPVTSNHVITCAVTTAIESSSSSSVKGTTITRTNSFSIPTGGTAGHETNPTHQQSHPLAHPQITNSDYNQYMSLAQKIVLQRKIVAVCDSVTRQQPQPNPEFESNAVSAEETQTSTIRENNQLPQRQVPNMAPVAQVSCQEPCPLSDKKCPIHSTTQRDSLERNRESPQQGNIIQQNLSEYRSGTSERQTSQNVDNQASNAVKTDLVTEPNKADQKVKPSNQTKHQQPMSRNGFFAQNPQEIYTLPTDTVNEDLDSMNHFELEALEKMVDHDLQSLVSGANTEENTPVINNDLKNKVLSEEFQRKIDRFLNDI